MNLSTLTRRVTSAVVAGAMALSFCAPALATVPPLPAFSAAAAALGQQNDAENVFDLSNGSIKVTVLSGGSQEVTVGGADAVVVAAGEQVVITQTGGETSNTIETSGQANIILNGVNIKVSSNSALSASSLLHLTLADGSVNTLKGDTRGISCMGAITIDGGGTLNASGRGYGIFSQLSITINGGTINANTDRSSQYGIYSYQSSVNITDGVINASGTSAGIYGYNGITIRGGNVKANTLTVGYGGRNISGSAKVLLTGQNSVNRINCSGLAADGSGWLVYKDGDKLRSVQTTLDISGLNEDSDPADFTKLTMRSADSFNLSQSSITVTVNDDGSPIVNWKDADWVVGTGKPVTITQDNSGTATNNTITVEGSGTANITLNGVNINANDNYALSVSSGSVALNLTLAENSENILKGSNIAIDSSGKLAITGAGAEKGKLTAESTSGITAAGILANSITIENAEVKASGNRTGIYGDNDITIKNSTVTASGSENGIESGFGEVKITGSNIDTGVIAAIRGITIENSNVRASRFSNCSATLTGTSKVLLTEQTDVSSIDCSGLAADGAGWLVYQGTDGKLAAVPGNLDPSEMTVNTDPEDFVPLNQQEVEAFDLTKGRITVAVADDGSQTVEQNGVVWKLAAGAPVAITSNGAETANTIAVEGSSDDSQTVKLTLRDVKLKTTGTGLISTAPLELTLEDENELNGGDNVLDLSRKTTIAGSGSLKIVSGGTNGIYSEDTVTIAGNARVTIQAENGLHGIFGWKGVSIRENAVVDAEAGGDNGIGICSREGDITISDSADVTAGSQKSGICSYEENVVLSGSAKVKATDLTGKTVTVQDDVALTLTRPTTREALDKALDYSALSENGSITYTDMDGRQQTIRTGEPTPGPDVPGDTGEADAAGAVVAGVVIGGAALWGGYEIATRVILNQLLPEDAALPTNRAELALLVWNTAGRPEPAAEAPYADDTAKAVQWCAEQGYLDSAHPDWYVPKYRVIEVWNKAFPRQ